MLENKNPGQERKLGYQKAARHIITEANRLVANIDDEAAERLAAHWESKGGPKKVTTTAKDRIKKHWSPSNNRTSKQ